MKKKYLVWGAIAVGAYFVWKTLGKPSGIGPDQGVPAEEPSITGIDAGTLNGDLA